MRFTKLLSLLLLRAGAQAEVDQILYEAAEDLARTKGIGLWRDPDPVPPWEWRRR